MQRKTWIALLTAGCMAAAWSSAPNANDDPWVGKSRSAVETLLGDPTKTKKKSNGAELLIYKLVRLVDGAIPPPGMTVLNVPGVGVVGRMQKPGALSTGDLTIHPTEMDAAGRGTGGGVTAEETVSVTWDTDGKQIEHSWEERPAIRGKLTLKFQVAHDGSIKSWAVSPKKAVRDR